LTISCQFQNDVGGNGRFPHPTKKSAIGHAANVGGKRPFVKMIVLTGGRGL